MVRITAEELRRLRNKAARPQVRLEPGDVLAVFVPGHLKNPKNASLKWQAFGWGKYKKQWRERVSHALLEFGWNHLRHKHDPARPMCVMFTAHVRNLMDDDGLALSLAAARDELVRYGVISNDSPRDGHEFVYTQQIERTWRGVVIRVRPIGPT